MKMGVGFWIVAIAAGVGGYFACRGLKTMEEEIRDEIASREAAAGGGEEPPGRTRRCLRSRI